MASEGYYQKRIIKWFNSIGGYAYTGNLPTGEADVPAGYPHRGRLLNVYVEVKTPDNYKRLLSGLELVDERYIIVDEKKLKKHEPLQIHKLNLVRDRGGMSIIAATVDHVKEYIEEELPKC